VLLGILVLLDMATDIKPATEVTAATHKDTEMLQAIAERDPPLHRVRLVKARAVAVVGSKHMEEATGLIPRVMVVTRRANLVMEADKLPPVAEILVAHPVALLVRRRGMVDLQAAARKLVQAEALGRRVALVVKRHLVRTEVVSKVSALEPLLQSGLELDSVLALALARVRVRVLVRVSVGEEHQLLTLL
jgi:hypothetical protein